jgi:hypothetical protein
MVTLYFHLPRYRPARRTLLIPFEHPFYLLLLNTAVGGSWPDYPDETHHSSTIRMAVDWVRVYQSDTYPSKSSYTLWQPQPNQKLMRLAKTWTDIVEKENSMAYQWLRENHRLIGKAPPSKG